MVLNETTENIDYSRPNGVILLLLKKFCSVWWAELDILVDTSLGEDVIFLCFLIFITHKNKDMTGSHFAPDTSH